MSKAAMVWSRAAAVSGVSVTDGGNATGPDTEMVTASQFVSDAEGWESSTRE